MKNVWDTGTHTAHGSEMRCISLCLSASWGNKVFTRELLTSPIFLGMWVVLLYCSWGQLCPFLGCWWSPSCLWQQKLHFRFYFSWWSAVLHGRWQLDFIPYLNSVSTIYVKGNPSSDAQMRGSQDVQVKESLEIASFVLLLVSLLKETLDCQLRGFNAVLWCKGHVCFLLGALCGARLLWGTGRGLTGWDFSQWLGGLV